MLYLYYIHSIAAMILRTTTKMSGERSGEITFKQYLKTAENGPNNKVDTQKIMRNYSQGGKLMGLKLSGLTID